MTERDNFRPNTASPSGPGVFDTILLSHETELDLRTIVAGEGEVAMTTMQDYGLSGDLAGILNVLIHDANNFDVVVHDTHQDGRKVVHGVKTYTDRDTGKHTTYIMPETIVNYVTDAYHSIEPVGGDEELAFARDTGVRMAYQLALGNGIFHFLANEYASIRAVKQLSMIGADDLPDKPQDYRQLFPYRLGARLAIDRLEGASNLFFDPPKNPADPWAGQAIVIEYLKHRRRALSALQHGSYDRISFIDKATLFPLAREDTAQYITSLQTAITKHRNGLRSVD